MHYTIAIALLTVLTACGGKKNDASKGKQDAMAGPTVAPIAPPQIGVDSIKRMNFLYGDGMKEYERALTAYRAKPRDWAAVRANCEATLSRDPHHLDAHRVLASALAQAGEHAAAVDHVVTALAGDYFKYGPALAKDEDLKELLATPHGIAINEVAAKVRAAYLQQIGKSILVIGRRSPFRWPKEGVQPATSRGELYAFDRETRRYLRLTHTEHQVAAVVRAPGGGEVAVVGFDKIDRPKNDDAPPLVTRAWLQILETKEWSPVGGRVVIGGGREISAGYGAGDQLLVATAPANGRWGAGEPQVSSLDKTTGKLTKVKTALPTPRVVFSLEEGRVLPVTEGVAATWSGEPATTPTLGILGGPTIQVPESGIAGATTIALSPDRARLAFATVVDPCSKDTAPSLYVAETKTGALKHLLTAKSRFVTRWLDPSTLAYEDGDGALRLWDAASGREAMRLENKPGIALDVLSLAAAALCKGAPPTAEPVGSGSGDEPPMPPEEGSAGPITTPQ
ncbi:MAG: hypothetical protein H0T89_07105 [Deltaproteobacteria bacterium]|nr:hypothetical protein [Deltaproteobacteria bacterium]MDQ3299168.1 bacterial transcriptional activator domain-containing protein [Myxococcota bacterium]